MRYEYKHTSFNPVSMGFGYGFKTNLLMVCEREQEEGWELVRIVPNGQFEAVAVFQRNSDGTD